MSLPVSGIGSVQPVFAPSAPAPYASNSASTASVGSTIGGAEAGAAAVVYEPGPSDASDQHIYARRSELPQPAPQSNAFVGDEAVVEATGGASLPPPRLPETPRQAEIRHLLNDVWAPVGPINIDPASANGGAQPAPPPVGQAEASAQASYAAIADAQIAGASVTDVEKFA
ncbi:MAG: hypothetical protein J7498_14365 [Sphingobium sp.]|nr:hypothetical protein [Sphingobium sp.]